MSHWPFVIAAYAATIVGTLGLILWSYTAMRRAETDTEAVRRDR